MENKQTAFGVKFRRFPTKRKHFLTNSDDNLKGYLHYKMITSQNVSPEAKV